MKEAYLAHGINRSLSKFVGKVVPLNKPDAVLALGEKSV